MIVKIDHIHFYSGDIEKMAAYFRDVFGGTEISRDERSILNLMTLDPKTEQFETGKNRRGLDHIGFLVKDIEATLEEMKKNGVRISTDLKVLSGGAKMAFVDGPEGIRIELMERF
jgi:catechol 2,3-dioxygenase-like lactoylglutathione lyase family enzyme